MFVHDIFRQNDPSSIAFLDEKNITYGQVATKIDSYRNYFHHLGIATGENVGLLSRNCAEYIYAYLALTSLGAIVVPINFQLSEREIAFIIKDANIKHLITKEQYDLANNLAVLNYTENLIQLLISDIDTIAANFLNQPAPKLPATYDAKSTCVIIYTSGTTGNPKGAMLSHENLVTNAKMFKQALDISADDKVLCILPMYHCFAWTCSVLNPFLSGSAIYILDNFIPKETIDKVKSLNLSVIYAVPPIYNLLLRTATKDDFSKLRVCVSGGATLPVTIAQQFKAKFNIDILEGYGLSEASPVVAVNPLGKPKVGSIGKILPGLNTKLVDDTGAEVPLGEIGELLVQGPTVMNGYYNLPEATAKTIINGWLHTGDLAYKDADDYYFIVDRLKDMIINNGENIYPREIEELLYAYPGIIEAAVVGIDDPLRGQTAAAYIVMTEDSVFDKKKLKKYLAENLAIYKIPREFHQMSTLPKTSTGKILKRALSRQGK